MTRGARLPVDEFEHAGGPALCVLSGKPTNERVELTVRARETPTWLLFLGIFPYVVARLCTKRSTGSLPLTKEVQQLLATRAIKLRTIAVPGAVVMLLGVLTLFQLPGLGIILLIAPCSFVVTTVLLNRLRSPLSPVHLEPAGRWVVIPNAAEEYAAALDDQPAAAPPPPELSL